MNQTDILFFHNFWIFHLWDHFLAKKLGEGGEGGMDQDCVPILTHPKVLKNVGFVLFTDVVCVILSHTHQYVL